MPDHENPAQASEPVAQNVIDFLVTASIAFFIVLYA